MVVLKRIIPAVLLLCFLCACGAQPRDTGVRANFAALPGATFHAKIFSDTGQSVLEYELNYVYNKTDSDSLTLTAPQALSGIRATISGKQKSDMTLQYENTVLDTPGLSKPGLTPADCIPALLYELRSSVPSALSEEHANGVALTMLKYQDLSDGSEVTRQIWIRSGTCIPVCAEIYVKGQRILQCRFSDWKAKTA